MSFLSKVVNLLQPKQPSAIKVVNVTSSGDYSELPQGFFRVITASAVESLGYNGTYLCWSVGETVVDGGKRITLSVPRAELPIVNLSFTRLQQGVQQVGGLSFIDTDELDGDGEVGWDGPKPSNGVDYV